MFLILFAAAPETCCAMIPLASERKGSISSARPSALKTLQWCFSITGLNLSSTLTRCLHPSSSMLPVVVVATPLEPCFDGLSSRLLQTGNTCVPFGVSRIALVWSGFAGRSCGGTAVLSSALLDPFRTGVVVVISPIADGVGVNGSAVTSYFLWRFAGVSSGGIVVVSVASLLRDLFFSGAAALSTPATLGAACTLAERRRDISKTLWNEDLRSCKYWISCTIQYPAWHLRYSLLYYLWAL